MNARNFLWKNLFLTLICLSLLPACASSRSGSVYSRDQALREMRVQYGTITSIRDVQIEGTQSGIGAVAGGVTGGVLGSFVGGGRGQIVGGVLGALAGAGAGALAEEGITRKSGLEIMVELDNGEAVSVVQEADNTYYIGSRVRVLRGADGSSRVQY